MDHKKINGDGPAGGDGGATPSPGGVLLAARSRNQGSEDEPTGDGRDKEGSERACRAQTREGELRRDCGAVVLGG